MLRIDTTCGLFTSAPWRVPLEKLRVTFAHIVLHRETLLFHSFQWNVCAVYTAGKLLKTKLKRRNIHGYFRCTWCAKMRNDTVRSLSVVAYVFSWSEGGISEWKGQCVTKPSKLLFSGRVSLQTGFGPWTQALLRVFPQSCSLIFVYHPALPLCPCFTLSLLLVCVL